MNFTVKRYGMDKLAKRLDGLIEGLPAAIAPALYQKAEETITVSKGRTPVDTGALRASQHVEGPEVTSTQVKVRMVAGGPSAPYGLMVHENPDAYHPTGEYKFLEKSVLEKREEFKEAIKQAIVEAFKS